MYYFPPHFFCQLCVKYFLMLLNIFNITILISCIIFIPSSIGTKVYLTISINVDIRIVSPPHFLFFFTNIIRINTFPRRGIAMSEGMNFWNSWWYIFLNCFPERFSQLTIPPESMRNCLHHWARLLFRSSLCRQTEAAGRSTTSSKACPIITGKRHSVGASWDAHIQVNS